MVSALPADVILDEILTRTSPETIAKCRVVCKEWNEATHRWSFAEKFHRRTKTVSGFFIQSLVSNQFRWKFISTDATEEKNTELSLSFVPGKITKIEAAAKQGLILCLREASPQAVQYIVCKPTTKQWTQIPKPKTQYFTRKTAMAVLSSNPTKLRFKIVRFSDPKQACVWRKSRLYWTIRCEFFDSATWAWRSLPENVSLPAGEIVLFDTAASVGGFFFSLTTKMRVFAFDWDKESWEVVALPEPLSHPERPPLRLVDWEGKLGLVSSMDSNRFMELWLWENIEDGGIRAWNMRKRVDIEGCFSYVSPLALCCSDVGVFWVSSCINLFRFGSCDSLRNRIVKVVKCGFCDMDGLFMVESDHKYINMKKSRNTMRSIESTTNFSLM